MSKKRTDLNEFAIPIPGVRARGGLRERIRIEGVRDRTSSSRSQAPSAANLRGQEYQTSFAATITTNGAAAVPKRSKEELAKLEDSELLTLFQTGDERAFIRSSSGGKKKFIRTAFACAPEMRKKRTMHFRIPL